MRNRVKRYILKGKRQNYSKPSTHTIQSRQEDNNQNRHIRLHCWYEDNSARNR